MRKDAQAVLLVLVGGALLKISYTGTYLRYVKPSSRWLLVAAGLTLIAVAAVTLWQVVRGQRSDHDGHKHHGEPRIGMTLHPDHPELQQALQSALDALAKGVPPEGEPGTPQDQTAP